MNNIVSAFAKICACTGILFGAPIVAFSAAHFTLVEIQKGIDYQLCVDAEKLNRIGTICVR
jgi:hypothetical protein